MDQEMFFYQVDREAAEIEMINKELSIIADENIQENIDAAYKEWLQAMTKAFYDEVFPVSEWDI